MSRNRIAAWNLSVFALSVLVVELIFGNWVFGPDFSSLNVNMNSVRVDRHSELYPPGSKVVYTRDRYGLRGDFGDPARIDLLAVGGSTTNDRVCDDRDAWTAVLQRELRSDGWTGYVANAGVDGHSTVGHIRSFDLWFSRIPGLKPQFYLFYVGVNDRGVARGTIPQPDSLSSPSLSRRITSYASNHSFFIQKFRYLAGLLAARKIGVISGTYRPDRGKVAYVPCRDDGPSRTDEALLDDYRSRLEILQKLVVARGGRAVYVTQPTGFVKREEGRIFVAEHSGADAVFREMIGYNRTLMRFCESAHAICIDLAGELSFDERDFYDTVHTTPAGSRKIGLFLAHKLRNVMMPQGR